MPRDKVGNVLGEKDLIQVTYTAPSNPAHSVELIGRIVKITEGNIVIPKGQNLARHPEQQLVTPGTIKVIVDFDVAFDPSQPILLNVVKCADPTKESSRKTGLLAQ